MLNEFHDQILKKFDALKGETLVGKIPIKGIDKERRVPADIYVKQDHILHDLIRGFYKPAGMPYVLSYQATESSDNYGKQIIWNDELQYNFKRIEMHPPSSPKDNRKKSDIAAAHYNLEHQIPIGLLFKLKKGVNVVLGLGMITKENEQGVFIVEPYSLKGQNTKRLIEEVESATSEATDIAEDLVTELVGKIKQRKGQERFRASLLERQNECSLCDIEAKYSYASHIKPWAVSDNYERLDANNGLLLCPNHDYLFDKGLITFRKNGQILISNILSTSQKQSFNISPDMKIVVKEEMEEYMNYHNQIVYKKESHKK